MESAFLAFAAAEDLTSIISAFDVLQQHSSKTDISEGPVAGSLALLKELSRTVLPTGADLFKALAPKLEQVPPQECDTMRVLVVGGGPGGLRTAIESRLTGAHVELAEKRNEISRHNVLHLWSPVAEDGLSIGLKSFIPRLGSGGSEKVAIKTLQLGLVKVALLLGVKIHCGLSFQRVAPPSSRGALWAASFHVSGTENDTIELECDMLVGADGENSGVARAVNIKSSMVQFSKALGITFNFMRGRDQKERQARDLARVSYKYRDWFEEVETTTGVALENLVYTQSNTHYFVMAARPESLIASGILLHEEASLPNDDVPYFLHPSNVNRKKLLEFTRQMAVLVGLPNDLVHAKDHHSKADVGIFDFTKKRACQTSSHILDSATGRKLLVNLVGDAAVAPFWPQGTGANLAVLGAFDSTFALQNFAPLVARNAPDEDFGVMLSKQLKVFLKMKGCTPSFLLPNTGGTRKALWTTDPATRYAGYVARVGEVAKGHLVSIGADAALTLCANEDQRRRASVKSIDTNSIKVITCYRQAWSDANKGQAVPSAAPYTRALAKENRPYASHNPGSFMDKVAKRSSIPSAAEAVSKAIATSTALAAASRRAASQQQTADKEKAVSKVGNVNKGSLASRILAATASAGKRASLRVGGRRSIDSPVKNTNVVSGVVTTKSEVVVGDAKATTNVDKIETDKNVFSGNVSSAKYEAFAAVPDSAAVDFSVKTKQLAAVVNGSAIDTAASTVPVVESVSTTEGEAAVSSVVKSNSISYATSKPGRHGFGANYSSIVKRALADAAPRAKTHDVVADTTNVADVDVVVD